MFTKRKFTRKILDFSVENLSWIILTSWTITLKYSYILVYESNFLLQHTKGESRFFSFSCNFVWTIWQSNLLIHVFFIYAHADVGVYSVLATFYEKSEKITIKLCFSTQYRWIILNVRRTCVCVCARVRVCVCSSVRADVRVLVCVYMFARACARVY